MQVTPLENWIVQRAQLNQKSQDALNAYQIKEIQKIVHYAKEKSRFYQEALKNIDVDSIKSLEDFERIPFTTPSDIKRAAYDFLCVGVQEIERIVTLNTSGTTGDEKRIFFTHEDLEATIDFFQYGMSCLVDENDCVMVLLPGPAYGSIGDLLKSALMRSGIKCVVHGVLQDIEKTAQCIKENNITCIVGIPMQVRYLRLMKPELFYRFIKKVLLSTDYVPTSLVKTISRNGECRVFNHYGMTEMGYGGGVECQCLNGYHFRENHLYVEIVDPVSGRRVRDGEYGEVVFTTFNRQAMPLIRYQTGDMARFLSQPCGCGTFLRTMEKVHGRIGNRVVINSKEVHLHDLDEIILAHDEVADYKAWSYGEEALHIKLVLSDACEASDIAPIVHADLLCRFECEVVVTWARDTHLPQTTNSMIKRKIYNLSKEDER